MLEFHLISDDDAGTWDRYVSQHRSATFYHEYSWRKFFRDFLRKETYYLTATSGGKCVGVLPMVRQKSRIFGDYIVSLPFLNYGGALVDDNEVLKGLIARVVQLAAEPGSSYVELRGLEPVCDLPCKTKKVSMRLSLPDSADELHASFSSKLRSQIRRPVREGPKIRYGGAELLDSFYSVFSRNMRDLGTPVYSKKFFRDIVRRFRISSEIVVIELNGQPIAAAFLFHKRGMSEIPWASSDRRYNRISINMLLYWEVLKRSIDRGSEVFDFGRSTRDSGTFRFKKQWGAEPTQLCWSYVLADGAETPELDPDNKKYALAIRAWQKLPLPIANTIGPFLARNLP